MHLVSYSMSDCITKAWNAILGHDARLLDDTPVHQVAYYAKLRSLSAA